MTIDVRCYSCGAAYAVSDDNAGKKLRCSTCQTVVTIPSRPHTVAEGFNVRDIAAAAGGTPFHKPSAGSPSAPPALPEGSGAASGGSKVGIIIAAVGGGVVLLAGLIVGIVFAVKAANSDGKTKDDDRGSGATGRAAGNGGDGRAGITPAANGGRRTGFATGGNATTVYSEHLRWIRAFSSRIDDSAAAAGRVMSRISAQREARVVERVAADLETIVRGAERLARPTAAQQRLLKSRLERELSRHNAVLRVAIRSSRWNAYRNDPAVQRATRRMDAVIRRARAVYR